MKSPSRISAATSARSDSRVYSTTEGRQHFPDILQTTFGEKAVIGFDRYGRALGAVVPMEAVRLLAGLDKCVDEHVRLHIQRTALKLLLQMPAEAKICGLADPADGVVDIEEVEAARNMRKLRKGTARSATR